MFGANQFGAPYFAQAYSGIIAGAGVAYGLVFLGDRGVYAIALLDVQRFAEFLGNTGVYRNDLNDAGRYAGALKDTLVWTEQLHDVPGG